MLIYTELYMGSHRSTKHIKILHQQTKNTRLNLKVTIPSPQNKKEKENTKEEVNIVFENWYSEIAFQ